MELGNPHTPQRFGRYILLDRMGAGGMAEVFRAVMPGADGFRSDLVIKRILSEQALAPNFIEMFGHEARISALLHHPNIVQVFDFGLVDGSHFLAMELLRGCDLLRVMRALRERRRMFPIPIAAHIAHQVARGLGHAHALTSPDGSPLHIVHRDVSPSNIMCLRAGGVKLLDFGIASALGEVESGEETGWTFKGKLSYMAPERLRNEPADGRIDLFALGAVLWEILTARRLFPGKTDADKVKAVLERPIPPPSALRPEVSPRLDEIVMRALERDPEKRYAMGHALADDLEQVVLDSKFQSRMLPALLNELFGTAPSSSHIALSLLSPELLALEPTPSFSSPQPDGGTARLTPGATASAGSPVVQTDDALGDTPRAVFTDDAVVPLGSRSKRRLMIAAAIVGTMMGLAVAIVIAARPGGRAGSSHSASDAPGAPSRSGPQGRGNEGPPEPASPQLPSPSRGESVTAPESGRKDLSTPMAFTTRGVSPALPRSRANPAAASLRSRPAGGRGGDRITRGLSIDPFAEAAARAGTR